MATTWFPIDLASICPEQQAPLTQCSSAGFMFLSLVVQLFGGVTYSINYPKQNPYPRPPQLTQFDLPDYNTGFTSFSKYDPSSHQSYEHDLYNSYNPITDLESSVYHTRNTFPSYSQPLSNPFGLNFKKHKPVFNYDYIGESLDLNNIGESLDLYIDESKIKTVSTGTNKKENKLRSRRRRHAKEYDFIIVGAGSAGCVLANRLSEVKKWRVLLIEAGPEEPDVTMVPSLAPTLKASTIDWKYRTQPEPLTCKSLRGQTCAWPRGRTMGGTSAINFIVYMRGNRLDYDHWADLGNHGWSYNELLPYFKKSENNRAIEAYDTHHHGVGGPITVERYPYVDVNTVMLVEAFKESGLPEIDLTGENNIGTNIGLSTSTDGRRMSINVAYIRPIRDIRPNIDIIVNAFATKLIIDPKTKTALGVTYEKNGVVYNVYAKKEVLVSSGALNSPKLLMLSGIGPTAHLEKLDIPVIADLPVGKNLQDHVTTDGLTVALSNKTSTLINNQEIFQEVQNYYHQKQKKSGPLSTTNTLNGIGFIKTKFASVNAPDIQFHFDGRNVGEFLSDPQTYLETNIYPLAFYNGLTARPILLTPKSRGFVLLNETDPVYGQPLIYPGFFTVKEDMDTMIEGLRYAVSLEETEAFKRNGAYYVKVPVKNCESHIWGSYDYFACILIQYTSTIFHPVGTCKMGPAWDEEAVVDPRLRVYGVKKLRVIDASIMPYAVRGNTNIPTVTIAEYASDMIKEDYLTKRGHH